MINTTNISRLMMEINDNLKSLELYCDAEREVKDVEIIDSQIKFAVLESVRVHPQFLQQTYDVLHLHDRLKAITVSIQIKRNNVERADELAIAALTKCREIQRAIEPPLQADDEL